MPGIFRQTLYDIINEKQPVTPGMALRLAKMFGGSADSWLNLQRAYDLQLAEAELAEQLKSIPELKAA
ncbi:HigA family addiction module antitoxin [Blastomonas sp.]|uniref:HigA family addiction module antitoxin n=1 Tax=Blastomonas sp. TaxID=1909299 RepID=UPI00359314D4